LVTPDVNGAVEMTLFVFICILYSMSEMDSIIASQTAQTAQTT